MFGSDAVFHPDISLRVAGGAVRVQGNTVQTGNWECVLSGLAGELPLHVERSCQCKGG